ncbi:MAG: thioredoxin family protein, partial [Bdellovibrionota bacterium]
FILLIGSPALALSLNAKTEASSEKSTVSAWAPFDENLVAEKRKTQSVFIDFTASWCITCQVNKRTVLDTKEIQDLFKVHDVFLIRADWTNQDPKITQALASFGRNSVPFYVFYNKMQKPPGSPQVLPELLTKDLVKEVIQGEMK